MNFSKEINELHSIYANKPETKECYQTVSKCFFAIIKEISVDLEKILIEQRNSLGWSMPITSDELEHQGRYLP
jgi:hypothetical protein